MDEDRLRNALLSLCACTLDVILSQKLPYDRESVIEIALSVGRASGVTREEIETVLDTPVWTLVERARSITREQERWPH